MLCDVMMYADILPRGIEPTLWTSSFFARAPPLKHSIPVPYFYFLDFGLLFPGWSEERVQLVDVFCSEHLHVPTRE